ncbi:thioesterase II family protein [Streptomyces sp. rh34]|uniref:thioesterase II family protein n=1 Tax=Streptomyces sp. rh34 TaxID=2034272 RepID=UPI0015CF26A1|nr:thioesterase [Streptomyces sp. rh34]
MNTGRWLIREPDPEAAARLFCFPISGMGASVYRQWPERIGGYDVCPVQLPGRENRMREQPFATMEEFAEQAADALGGLLDRPYAVFGQCFGARLGYALVGELVTRRLPLPARFFASGCLAPHQGGRFGPFSPETTDEEYTAELLRACRTRGEPEPPAELLAMSVRVLKPDVALSCGYVPAGPDGPPFPITSIGWKDDSHVRPDEMGAWEAYGKVDHVVLPGDDSTFRTAPRDLLDVLTDGLPAEERLPL